MSARRFSAVLACVLLFAHSAAADLSDFERRVQNAEAKAAAKEEEEADNRTDEQKRADAELLAAILRLWFYLNFAVDYDDYPYASGPYVRYRNLEDGAWKFHRFSAGADAYWTADGIGVRAEFEGKALPFIGPRLDATVLGDGKDRQYFIGVGGQMSLFQTRWVCADVYGQWIAMRGLVQREGGAGGLALTIYPGSRLSVSIKVGGQNYRSGLELGEWNCSIGRHFGRYEVYGGWRSLGAEDAELLGGFFLGGRVHY